MRAVTTLVGLVLACQAVDAQVVAVYSPVVPAPVYVHPGPVAVATPYAVASPVVAPAPMVASRPIMVPAPAPVVVTPQWAATPVVTTRYRPILGGTVSRVRYRYAPVGVVTPLY